MAKKKKKTKNNKIKNCLLKFSNIFLKCKKAFPKYKNIYLEYKNILRPSIPFFYIALVALTVIISRYRWIFTNLNGWILLIVLFSIALFIGLLFESKGEIKIIVAACSILVIVIIFVAQYILNTMNKFDEINSINRINCGVANNNITLQDSMDLGKEFVLNYFVTDVYDKNFALINQYYGKETEGLYQWLRGKMEATNTLIEMVIRIDGQGLLCRGSAEERKICLDVIKRAIEKHNNQIIDYSEEIKAGLRCEIFKENEHADE